MLTNYIRASVDYLILNAYSLKNIGFYNGKAGISLCLFELAKHLEDELIEEDAFELLQESLVLGEKKNDIGFENGLAGIGFVLLYLIQNKFIDADFEDLFGESAKIILSVIESKESHIDQMILQLYFLTAYNQVIKDEKINPCITKIVETTEGKFRQQINESNSSRFKIDKQLLLNGFVAYLKAVLAADYPVSFPVIEGYSHLFRQEKLQSCFEIAFYLKQLIKDQENSALLSETIETNEKYGLRNIELNHRFYTLPQRIDLLFLLHQYPERYTRQIELLEQSLFEQSDADSFQKKILSLIPRNKFIPGYESGIARLLLYSVYREQKKEEKDVRRFNSLFL